MALPQAAPREAYTTLATLHRMDTEPNSTSGDEDAYILHSADSFTETVTNFVIPKPLILYKCCWNSPKLQNSLGGERSADTNIIINTLSLGSPIMVTYHIHRKIQQRALQEKHDSVSKNWQQLTEVSQQCQWKIDVRSNSKWQGGKSYFPAPAFFLHGNNF